MARYPSPDQIKLLATGAAIGYKNAELHLPEDIWRAVEKHIEVLFAEEAFLNTPGELCVDALRAVFDLPTPTEV